MKKLPLVLTFTFIKSDDFSKQEGDFFKFLWPFQKSWTLPIVIWQVFLTAILHRGLRIFFSFTLHLIFGLLYPLSVFTFIFILYLDYSPFPTGFFSLFFFNSIVVKKFFLSHFLEHSANYEQSNCCQVSAQKWWVFQRGPIRSKPTKSLTSFLGWYKSKDGY